MASITEARQFLVQQVSRFTDRPGGDRMPARPKSQAKEVQVPPQVVRLRSIIDAVQDASGRITLGGVVISSEHQDDYFARQFLQKVLQTGEKHPERIEVSDKDDLTGVRTPGMNGFLIVGQGYEYILIADVSHGSPRESLSQLWITHTFDVDSMDLYPELTSIYLAKYLQRATGQLPDGRIALISSTSATVVLDDEGVTASALYLQRDETEFALAGFIISSHPEPGSRVYTTLYANPNEFLNARDWQEQVKELVILESGGYRSIFAEIGNETRIDSINISIQHPKGKIGRINIPLVVPSQTVLNRFVDGQQPLDNLDNFACGCPLY